MDLQLEGKRALVTGSSSGIGRGIAAVLAREGAAVIVHGRNRERTGETARSIRDAGGTAHIAFGDLATDAGAAQVADAVERATGGIDILVNNIGGTESTGPGPMLGWFDVKPEHWAGAMEQNLISAVRMIHAFVPAMRDRGWGRVISISSAGAIAPPSQVPEYCAAKAGLLNMTVSLSKELARSGVTVNAVCPGCTRTEMFEGTLRTMGDAQGWPQDIDAREALFMDLGIFPCTTERYGRPDDIGTLVAFLASPLAAFVNGANYRIDGGQVQSIS
ncbi:MAG: SDR family oxidoreductase [Novosphingobium sp.]|jgi:NAD(P)-dependent dehydrogenase (short-subunit alcohol dehydrogenase family)|nr:SDR family oxidoreductase [Novosphingobium sp.]